MQSIKQQSSQSQILNNQSFVNEIVKKGMKSKDCLRFLNTLKIQQNYKIMVSTRIIEIIQKYSEMQPQLIKRTEEAQILFKYNKKLLEWIDIFREHQKKILEKIYKLQQINIKYMRQFCIIKHKDFNIEEYKPIQSIFINFRISQWRIADEVRDKFINPQIIQLSYKQKLLQIFKKTILIEETALSEILVLKIRQISDQEDNKINLKVKCIQKLIKRIQLYKNNIQKVNFQNMFDLYIERKDIHIEAQIILQKKYRYLQNQQSTFVNQVLRLHSAIQKIDNKELIKIIHNQRQRDITLYQMKIQQIEKCQQQLQELIQVKNEYLQDNQRLKAQNTQLFKELSVLKTSIKQKEAQLQYKSMKSNSFRRMNSINSPNVSLVYDEGNDQVKKLKYLNKSLEGDINQQKFKYQQAINQITKLKEKIKNLQQQILQIKQTKQNIQIKMVQIPVPTALFYTVAIPIHNKLLQIIKKRLLIMGFQVSNQQNPENLIQRFISTMQGNEEKQQIIRQLNHLKQQLKEILNKNDKLLEEIQNRQAQNDKIIYLNQKIKNQNNRIAGEKEKLSAQIINIKKQAQKIIAQNQKMAKEMQTVKQDNIKVKEEIMKVKKERQSILQDFAKLGNQNNKSSTAQKMLSQMVQQSERINQQNQVLASKNQKLQELHERAVERINSSEKMVCQTMDSLMKTALAGPQEAIKEIQNSLIQLKNMLRGQNDSERNYEQNIKSPEYKRNGFSDRETRLKKLTQQFHLIQDDDQSHSKATLNKNRRFFKNEEENPIALLTHLKVPSNHSFQSSASKQSKKSIKSSNQQMVGSNIIQKRSKTEQRSFSQNIQLQNNLIKQDKVVDYEVSRFKSELRLQFQQKQQQKDKVQDLKQIKNINKKAQQKQSQNKKQQKGQYKRKNIQGNKEIKNKPIYNYYDQIKQQTSYCFLEDKNNSKIIKDNNGQFDVPKQGHLIKQNTCNKQLEKANNYFSPGISSIKPHENKDGQESLNEILLSRKMSIENSIEPFFTSKSARDNKIPQSSNKETINRVSSNLQKQELNFSQSQNEAEPEDKVREQQIQKLAVNILKDIQNIEQKQPLILNEEYVEYIEMKLVQLKAKLRYHKQNPPVDQLAQLQLRYKQVVNCLEAAEKINRDSHIQYQNFIKQLNQSGTTSNCNIQMNKKIFLLQNHIKQLNRLLEEQKLQFQQEITKQIEQSEKIAKQILESFNQEIQQEY